MYSEKLDHWMSSLASRVDWMSKWVKRALQVSIYPTGLARVSQSFRIYVSTIIAQKLTHDKFLSAIYMGTLAYFEIAESLSG